MEKTTVDARGQLCPKPLIMTKKALKGFNGEVQVLLDNETAFENVKRFLTDNKKTFSSAAEGDDYTILVSSDGNSAEMSAVEEYCVVPATVTTRGPKKEHVICFKSELMGSGEDSLGKILIQAFCNTIKEAQPLPSALVFYNSGVKLAAKNSAVLPALKELELTGVKILVCGTCADFYGIKENIGVGIISNMYDITEALTAAGHVINP